MENEIIGREKKREREEVRKRERVKKLEKWEEEEGTEKHLENLKREGIRGEESQK